MPEKSLSRFLSAQEHAYEIALSEIRAGEKQSHWMWYIFPQIAGLGFSETAQYYAIENLSEARAYLAHPILGARLREISLALLSLKTNDALSVLGFPDNLKLCSCMTLFELAAPDEPIFAQVLEKFFGDKRDEKTVQIVGQESADY